MKVEKPLGYISETSGKKTASTRRVEIFSMSPLWSFGYRLKSSLGPNWVGLIKMLAMVTSFSSVERLRRLKCPSWREPIVGTKPMVLPEDLNVLLRACIALTVFITCIREDYMYRE
jgi:hypothetical protein